MHRYGIPFNMKLIISTITIVAVNTISCEAFVTQPAAATASLSSSSLLTRNSFFGFGETTTLTKSNTSANSKILIQKAEDILYNKSGFYSDYEADVFSEQFVFRGPNIGPLNKKDYLQTMDAFGIYKAIPDINPNAWGFSIDPNNSNKVWFMVRNTGTFNGENFAPGSINMKPNGATLEGCPETFSILFDDEQKVKYLSVGYVADRFEGNTGGKGAAVGIFNAIGLPFPKVGILQRLAQWIGTEVIVGSTGGLSYSVKDVPEWWTDENVGSDGYL